MATDFGTLKTQVLSWMNRSDLSNVVGDFINIANDKASRVLRIPANETFSTIALDVNDKIAIPSDYIEAKALTYASGGTSYSLSRKDYREVLERNSREQGLPQWFGREATNFILAPSPQGITEVDLYYWSFFPSLVNDIDTNYLVTNASDALLYGAISEGSLYLKKEEDAAIWQAKFNASLQELQTALEDQSEFSGGYIETQIYSG